MPPRISCPQGLSVLNLCLRPAAKQPTPTLLPLVQSANLSQLQKKRLRLQEPYKWAQIQARKTAKVERQKGIKRERDAAWGSPIHGIPTPFVESFDSAGQAPVSKWQRDANGELKPLPTAPELLNYGLTKAELEEAIATAYRLSKPLEEENSVVVDSVTQQQELQEHEERHRKAIIALDRITKVENANGKTRLHINIKRCVDEFGRHNTDNVLKPRPRAPGHPPREILQRGGPDTGSSEVQIAILTAKIRTLAATFEGKYGNRDKANRRNLRLLCHRRQKLLKYMESKERGSERWVNLLKTLGLSPATWKAQIAI
ncbi:ribosomal protein s15 precursor-like protein [Ophiostoma piceae UAMH 11346]|uniref:Ribosomal protein s15-like protein n=1 Tax=Ophiostoma piceae (strain UAMH 11346) TaxID=1262450 RepID=S3BV47_OPHP1|nr:ribosomal protein s15 precursor-like protein [Ophiostoma piceae UAMH 11346]